MISLVAAANRIHLGALSRRRSGRSGLAGRIGTGFLLFVVAVSTALVVAPATVLAVGSDWPQFRETQAHLAHNTTEFILSDVSAPGLNTAWTGATANSILSSPAVSNGVVYVGSTDGKLYAFAVGCASGGGTCTPIWTGATGGSIDSSPSVSGGAVYVGSTDGKLYAFAVGCATGGGTCTPLWTGTTLGAIHSSPTVDSGFVYVGSSDHSLYAFVVGCGIGNATCPASWTGPTGGIIESSPAVSAGVVYIGSDDDKLYAFAAGCATGGAACSPLWTATTLGHIFASPSVLTGVVYVSSLDGKLYAYNATNGALIWFATTGGPIYSSPSLGDGRVWVGSDDGLVYAFRVTCGIGGVQCTPQWTGTVGHAIRSSAASANDVLYVGANNGSMYAFDADCGTGGAVCTPIWTKSIGTDIFSSPAVSNGVVYVGSDDHKLYAFSLSGSTFHALTPTRILDTRANVGLTGAFSSHVARTFQVTGGISGVPNTALAVTGNVTVTQQTSQGFLFVGPQPANDPTSSTLNFPVGDDRANAVTVALGSGGTLSITYAAPILGPTAHVIFDLTGYFTPDATGATFHQLPPTRLLDTRDGTGLAGTFSSHVARRLQVTGATVPAGATAVTGNLTVTQQSSMGFLFAGPTQEDQPTSSTLNFPLGDDRANAMTVALDGTGGLWITYAAPVFGPTAHVIFDVTGYFTPDLTGARFTPLNPTRLLDSRSGTGVPGRFSSHVAQQFQVTGTVSLVPANAIAVTGNLTVTQQTTLGFLYVGPAQANNPTSSTLNFPKGDDRANAVDVALSPSGTLWVTFAAPTLGPTSHALFDVTGFFAP